MTHNELDDLTTALCRGVDDLALRLKAVLAHLDLNTAGPQRVVGARSAAAVRSGADGQRYSGRAGDTPVPGPAA